MRSSLEKGEVMIESWVKNKKVMTLKADEQSHWYLEWHEGWSCWMVSGVSLRWLIKNGWERLT
jgi:hypothetical protein